MKKFEKVSETIEREKEVDILCDICGQSEIDWVKPKADNTYCFTENDITISHKYSESEYDYLETETLELDICPKCFKEKILTYIKSIAVLPIEYRYWSR